MRHGSTRVLSDSVSRKEPKGASGGLRLEITSLTSRLIMGAYGLDFSRGGGNAYTLRVALPSAAIRNGMEGEGPCPAPTRP